MKPTPTPFGSAAIEALRIRKVTGATGPRTIADLARALGCNRGSLHRALHRDGMLRPSADEIRAQLPELP